MNDEPMIFHFKNAGSTFEVNKIAKIDSAGDIQHEC